MLKSALSTVKHLSSFCFIVFLWSIGILARLVVGRIHCHLVRNSLIRNELEGKRQFDSSSCGK